MNPKTKVFYQGRRINGRFDSFKAKLRRAGIYTVRAAVITTLAYAVFVLGAAVYSTDNITVANAETKTVEAPIAILSRIADCESGNGKPGTATQFKNGQVLISINTNGTYDQGEFQINSIHNKEAAALGYDLATEAGNAGYAKYLFLNRGSGDWSSSAHCWQH